MPQQLTAAVFRIKNGSLLHLEASPTPDPSPQSLSDSVPSFPDTPQSKTRVSSFIWCINLKGFIGIPCSKVI